MVEALPEYEILAQLNRITASKTFATSPRLIGFLRFCVETAVNGDLERLKESTVGVSVFGRDADYDPKIDPIVRVHARRLREKLETFYRVEAPADTIIVEIPKGGYAPRFTIRSMGGVLGVPAGEPIVPAAPAPDPRPLRSRFWWLPLRWKTLGMAALLCAVFGLVIALRSVGRFGTQTRGTSADWNPAPDAAISGVFPLTALPGSERDPAWSPDGKKIAFAWDDGRHGRSRLFSLGVDGGEPVALTDGAWPEYSPVWSASGASIAFIRQVQAFQYQVVIRDLKARTERVIRSGPFESPLPRQVPALDWSRNGQFLVTNELQAPNPAHLVLISVRDGHAERITDPPNASTGDLEARFSPDGQQIAFRRGGVGDLWLLDLRGAQAFNARPLTRDNPGVRGLCWSANGKEIFFGGRRGSNLFSIWRLAIPGDADGIPVQISPPGLEAVSPALGPDGTRLAFVRPQVDVNLWRYELAAPHRQTVFSASTHMEYQPAFSADGKQVAFLSDRSGPTEVWVSGADGNPARKVTALNGSALPFMPSWSPDGRKITYFSRRDGLNYAVEVPAQGGAEKVLEGGENYALVPQYSADGKSPYFVSNAGGRFRIWRKSLDGSASPAEVTTEEAEFFRLSRDGRWLFFLRNSSPPQLVRKDLVTNEQRTVWNGSRPIRIEYSWDVSGNQFYFLGQPAGREDSELIAADLVTKRETVLGNVRTSGWATGLAASRDGKSVLVSQVDRDDTDVMYLNLDSVDASPRLASSRRSAASKNAMLSSLSAAR